MDVLPMAHCSSIRSRISLVLFAVRHVDVIDHVGLSIPMSRYMLSVLDGRNVSRSDVT